MSTPEMTRFLLSLNDAVDVIFAAVKEARRGETYIPRVPAAKVTDIAAVLIDERKIETQIMGIRPGEKIHEALVSEEEAYRTVDRDRYYAILPILPEVLNGTTFTPARTTEYSSADSLMTREETYDLLKSHKLLLDDQPAFAEDELLR
jgi:FlaA1/EpsC-like NDP-sugar epimerase